MNLKSVLALGETILFKKVNLLLLITNLCNSRCNICNLWQQKKAHLPIKIIEKLLASKLVNKNGILLEGGEAILHPKIEQILEMFKGLNYVLLSNGLLAGILTDLVNRYKVPGVGLSLDGTRETYLKVRGIDGYQAVLDSIQFLKDRTKLSVCFTICPQNTFEDYLHVKDICLKNNIDLLLNIYSESEFSGKLVNRPIDSRYDKLKNPYINKYNAWARGEIKRNCFGMKHNCNIFPDGKVVLCQSKPHVVLGDLNKQSLEEIWMKRKAYCNDCWLACNRYIDARLL